MYRVAQLSKCKKCP